MKHKNWIFHVVEETDNKSFSILCGDPIDPDLKNFTVATNNLARTDEFYKGAPNGGYQDAIEQAREICFRLNKETENRKKGLNRH